MSCDIQNLLQIPMIIYFMTEQRKNWSKHYFTVGTVLTQKLVSVLNQVSDDFRGVGFSLKSGFKKIVLTQELVLVLNWVSGKYCLHQFFLYHLGAIGLSKRKCLVLTWWWSAEPQCNALFKNLYKLYQWNCFHILVVRLGIVVHQYNFC